MYNDTTLNVCQSSIFDCFQISDTNNTSRALKRTNTNMFHKEGSCTDIISSSNAGGGGKGGEKSKFKGNVKGKQQPPPKAQHLESTTNVSKAVDVPMRKSDRRRLRQRAAAYFLDGSSPTEVAAVVSETGNSTNINASDVVDVDDAEANDPNGNPIKALLDEIFLRGGTLSSRSLPRSAFKATNTTESKTKGNHENMVLYVKSPSSSDTESNAGYWPYQKKSQFVWMALEDKKSGKILHETPSVALLAVVWHAVIFPDPEKASAVSFRRYLERTRIATVPSPVTRYLCRGADLMRAGIISAPEKQQDSETENFGEAKGNHKKNQNKKDKSSISDGGKDMVVICAKGNPQPFAVGRSILWSNASDDKPYGYGTKGVGVEIWNCFGDDLWRTTIVVGGGATKTGNPMEGCTPSLENGSYGNPGFCSIETSRELCVMPLSCDGEEEMDDDGDDSESEKEEESTNEAVSSPSGDAASKEEICKAKIATASDIGEATPATVGDETSTSSQPKSTEGGDGDKSETNTETEALETEGSPSPDEILHAAVCQALVNLKKTDLPMLVGTFYTKHVMPIKPKGLDGTDLLKQTTYKKFGNYLRQWQMNDRGESGLVKTGPDLSNHNNKDPNAILVSFNRRHEDLYGMRKTKPAEASNNGSIDGNSKIALVKLYVVPQHWTSLLRLDPEDTSASNASSEARRGTGMLTLPEVKKLLDGYLQRESSLMVSKSTVALDGPLTDALYGKKSSEVAPERLSRKDLSKRFVDKMSPAYCMVQMPGSHVLKLGRGTPPKVQIEVVKRQSKKFVTRLRGLEEYLGGGSVVEPSGFCKDISKRLAISGSVDSDPASSGRAALPKKGRVEYIFGANIVDELEALLTGDESLSDHGATKGGWAYPRIPGSAIEVNLRKGVPARNKRRGGGGGNR
jgi:predicted ribosome-associated RNA-binding protein Tma20